MHSLWSDVRYTFRLFRAHPGVTVIAILSLALGMGANSTIFSLVDGMYLRPLPVRDPAGLVWVNTRSVEGREADLAWLDYLQLKESAGAFADLAVQNERAGLLNREGESELVLLTIVSDNFFPMLGVEAARGRLFRNDLDAAMANEPAIAISDSLWKRLGADPSLVGRTIRMNNRAFTVVGVLPPEFRGLDRGVRTDVWVPVSTWKAMCCAEEFEARGPGQFEVLGRLRPGATIQQAQAQLDAVTRRFQQENPETFRGRRLTAFTEQMREPEQGTTRSALLLAIVGLLLVIACANVAALLLAQAESRRREIGMRLALGANQRRLTRQLLTESAVLALIGAALALVLARWMIPLFPAVLPPGPDFMRYDIRLDGRVLLVTLAACAVTVLLFGLAPAREAARTDLNSVLKGGGWSVRRRFTGRNLLVAGQAALSVMLLSAAGLLARSFLHTIETRPGFDTARNTLVLLAALSPPMDRVTATCEQMIERIRTLPGVRQAAYCRRFPLSGSGSAAVVDVVIPARVATPGQEVMRLRFNQVSLDYFAVTGTRVVSGRAFARTDAAGRVRVALVNQTMARELWPKRDPVGQWIRVRNTDTQIVGVVEDAVIAKIHEPPEPFLYFPFAQKPEGEVTFLVETAGPPGPLLNPVKQEMRAADPSLAMLMTTSLHQHLRDAMYPDWLPAVLAAAIGGLGMALAAAGLFGVVLHSVNRRLRELAVRMALGARERSLLALVLRHGLTLTGAGAAIGAVLSLALGRLMSGFLYGVSPYDPLTLALSVAAVMAVSLAAGFYPAWKATRVDPAAMLRTE